MIGEDRRPPRASRGGPEQFGEAVAVKEIVAEHQRRAATADEIGADHEGLRETLRARLLGIGEAHAPG